MVESAPYEEIRRIGDVELREYPAIVVASVKGKGNPFRYLFSYISGNNKSRRKIAMTTPVITPEKIEMTSPVINREDTMSFVLPSKFSMETAPIPNDEAVTIEELPKRKVAVIRFRGWARARDIEKYTAQLLKTLNKENIGNNGPPFVMRYNAPYVPGFMRRNEVAVEIEINP